MNEPRPVSLGMLPLYPGDSVYSMYEKGGKIVRNTKTMRHDGTIAEAEEFERQKPAGNRKQRRIMEALGRKKSPNA